MHCLEIHQDRLFSGGDDCKIIIWDIETCKILETLSGHDNGITSISFAYHDLYTGSYDHHVTCWDLAEINEGLCARRRVFGRILVKFLIKFYTLKITHFLSSN